MPSLYLSLSRFAVALSLPIAASATSAPFTHPGILDSRFELDHLKSKVAAGAQ